MADITFADVTNATTMYDGTGYFDKLMKTMTLHIEDQYTKKRITGTEYSNAYLQIMQAALQSAQSFVLAEKLQEAQIDGIAAENLIKAKQLELETYRLTNTVPAELAQLTAQTAIANKQLDVETYKLVNMLPKELEHINAQIEMIDAQIGGITKDNLIKDEQILITTFDREFMKPKELESMDKDIEVKTEQILVTKQEVLKATYEITTLLPDQHTANLKQLLAIEKEITLSISGDGKIFLNKEPIAMEFLIEKMRKFKYNREFLDSMNKREVGQAANNRDNS